MGLRLPLDSLPWVAEADYPWDYPVDPMKELEPLVAATPGSASEFCPGHR